MFGEVKETVILGWMRDAVARPKRDNETEEAHAAMVRAVQEEIDKRKADPRFKITLRHIFDEKNPTLYNQMLAREESARHDAYQRARRALEAGGMPHEEGDVSAAMGRDPEWFTAMVPFVKAWVVAGMVDGEKEYARLMELGERWGGAGGGHRLLLDAAHEVKVFQTLTESDVKS